MFDGMKERVPLRLLSSRSFKNGNVLTTYTPTAGSNSSRRPLRLAVAAAGVLALLFLLLAIPAPAPVVPDAPAHSSAFQWGRDSQWAELEAAFRA